MNPDMCIPYNYTGYGDNQCFNACPINCGLDEIHCPAAFNPSTGFILVSNLNFFGVLFCYKRFCLDPTHLPA